MEAREVHNWTYRQGQNQLYYGYEYGTGHLQSEYAHETGREEGREEGHKVGKEEGLKEGREEGHKEGKEEGRKEGKEEGIKEGRAEGSKDERSKIAINLIRLGASCEIIAQATGLSKEEISRLKKELNNA